MNVMKIMEGSPGFALGFLGLVVGCGVTATPIPIAILHEEECSLKSDFFAKNLI